MLKQIFTYLFLLLNVVSYAQLPASQVNSAGYRKELFGGIMLHSQGWGITTSFTKFNTFKKRRLFTVDLISIKDPKEVKISAINDRNAKSFVYGKLNYVYTLRMGVGTKKTLYEPLRKNGIKISTVATFGPTITFVKPVYLEVFKIIDSQTIIKVVEKYNPDVHSLNDIYGRASFGYGFSDMKIVPGASIRAGLNFEKSIGDDAYRMIEVGAAIDGYPKQIQIMNKGKEKYVFATVYLNILLSRKYY